MSVGAAAVLEPDPSRPEILAERARFHAATLFFAAMLRAGLPLRRVRGGSAE